MKENWTKGLEHLPDECPAEQKTVIDALYYLIKSGNNIMNFYAMRERLSKKPANAEELLNKMEDIVKEEMKISLAMIDVCTADSRLGYHSEAENYKFFPAQLKKRINALDKLLATEFKTVRERIKRSEMPFIYKEPCVPQYKMTNTLKIAEKEYFGTTNAYFKAAYDEENLYLEFEGKKGAEFTIMFKPKPDYYTEDVTLKNGRKSINNYYLGLPKSAVDELLQNYCVDFTSGEKDKYKIVINRKKIGFTEDKPLFFRISADTFLNDVWANVENPFLRLGIYYVPEEFGKLIP